MLCDVNFCDCFFFGRQILGPVVAVRGFAIDKKDDIGILLDGSGIAQVGKVRDGRLVHFNGARQLGQGKDRQMELAGNLLQAAGNFGNLLHAIIRTRIFVAALHQLKIVDDDDAEAVLGLQAPRLGAELHDRQIRRVVDINRRLGKHAERVADAGEIIIPIRKPSRAELPRIHVCLGADHAVDKLLLGHFQGKDADRGFMFDSDRARDIEGQACFADRRAGGQDNEVGFLQSG